MRRAAALLLLLLLGTGCYDKHDTPCATESDLTSNLTLRELRNAYAGMPFEVQEDIRITGTVTTSDRADNFYRSFCIEQEGAAVEIMAGTDHLFNHYPIGCRVIVRLTGLQVAMHYGVLQIGRKPAPGSGFPTDYLGSKASLDRTVVRISEELIPPTPAIVFPEALSEKQCGTLVRISGLRYSPEGLEPASWAGYRRFTDPHDCAIYAYTRDYARWAQDPVPTGVVTLTGVLQVGTMGYTLKLRDENDCTN